MTRSILLVVLSFVWQLVSSSVTVNTTRGFVHGFHVDYGFTGLYYGKADVFLGIPYAQPPVGDLRFRLPRPICSYPAGGINATVQPPTCPSNPAAENAYARLNPRSEDCLYLNVITPSAKFGGPRPVIFYIYGGGLAFGSAYSFPHKGIVRQFASRGVVVVIAQYRLGVLGWFTTFTPEFPANRGLYDMITALKWVQEEIGAFGGDPNKVTIAGESAGSFSVSALSLSPLAQGLFHQTIQFSGGATLGIDFLDSPVTSTNNLQASVLCNFTETQWNTGNFAPLVTCMQDLPWESLALPTNLVVGSLRLGYTFVIDGIVLPDSLTKLAETRPNRPAMLGDMRDELTGFFGLGGDKPGIPADLSRFTPDFLAPYIAGQYNYLSNSTVTLLNDIINRAYSKDFHPPAATDNLGWLKLASEAMSDMIISMGVRRDANWQINNGNEDLYLFEYDYWSNVGAFYANFTLQGWKPVPHSAANPFIWMYTYNWEPAQNASKIVPNDIRIANFLADSLTNFAKHGRPQLLGWPAVSSKDEMEFFRIKAPWGRPERHFRQNSHAIFSSALPAMAGEWPAETPTAAAKASIEANYVPPVLAEYAAANAFCSTPPASA